MNGQELTVNTTKIRISYTENGVTLYVELTITVEANPEVKIEEYVEENIDDVLYLKNIKPSTTVDTVKSNIKNATTEVYNGETKITDGSNLIGTGMTIKVTSGTKVYEYTAVVTGDLTGDGLIKANDLAKMARYIANIDNNIEKANLIATDIVADNMYAKPNDILKMARILANIESLK